MFPPVEDVYYGPSSARPGASFTLYPPAQMPPRPPMKVLRAKDLMDAEQAAANGVELDEILKTSWPHALLDSQERSIMSRPDNVLRRCYENDAPYDANSPAMTITLETPLATGVREERPAQVWRVSAAGDSTPLVARIYDPLYFNTFAYDRFILIERAVTSENEAYTLLQRCQGSLVPVFRGVLVAEIPAHPPRHVYVIVLEYMPGVDLQTRMRIVGAITCSRHKAGLFNAVARASYPLYPCGVQPADLMDRNVILREPQEPSQEDFCGAEDCPFRNTLHVDLSDSPTHDHPYAPHVAIIDLESVRFQVNEYDLATCRRICHDWRFYCNWLSGEDIDTVLTQ
ncbi:hypothetical protein C8R46DRAFT_1057558 [Mycena filopes]|nr:hypothetical protein C8R46DRAFT_1057558 [Mycena filopes]